MPQVEWDVNGKVVIKNDSLSSPSNGTLGSAGARLIFQMHKVLTVLFMIWSTNINFIQERLKEWLLIVMVI